MKIIDLVPLLDFEQVIELCRTKLNGTFVQYNHRWWSCEINDSNYDEMDESIRYEDGYNWIHLMGAGGEYERLDTLEGIVTEPEWPDSGWYFRDGRSYELTYTTAQTYKAGLGSKILSIKVNNVEQDVTTKISLLNYILGEVEYPSIDTTRDILVNSANLYVPINDKVIVCAHPYIDGPVAVYKGATIGHVVNDYIKLTSKPPHLVEYLDHAGVKYE